MPIRSRVALAALLEAFLFAFGACAAGAADFVVTTDVDSLDATPGDGFCADADGACTLRAAVQEANALAGADRIELGAGRYLLSLAGTGEDAAASGDLDLDTLKVHIDWLIDKGAPGLFLAGSWGEYL